MLFDKAKKCKPPLIVSCMKPRLTIE